MRWLAGRLAVGSGRAEAARWVLVAAGAGLAALLLLSAVLVTAIRGGDCNFGCRGGVRYPALLDQHGLRPGVVTGLTLLVLPVLVFLGMCARVAAAARERRLAALRLAGATPGQVRGLAAADTAGPAALGALLGLLVFLVAKALLQKHYDQTSTPVGVERFQWLPTDVALPIMRSALALLLVPVLAMGSALTALRRVQVTPFGVSRRERAAPRAWAVAPLVAGLLLLAAGTLLGRVSLAFVAGGTAVVLLALASSGSWLAARAGALVGSRAGSPALLLAARRLQDDPRAQGRALFGIVLAVFTGCAVAVTRSSTLLSVSPGDSFYGDSYALVGLAVAVALVIAAAALLVASGEAVLDRRRTMASLWAVGVPLATVRRAVLLQALLPAVPAVLLTAASGTAAGSLYAGAGALVSVPWLQLVGVAALGLAAVVIATTLSLPLVRRGAALSLLRAP